MRRLFQSVDRSRRSWYRLGLMLTAIVIWGIITQPHLNCNYRTVNRYSMHADTMVAGEIVFVVPGNAVLLQFSLGPPSLVLPLMAILVVIVWKAVGAVIEHRRTSPTASG